MKEIICTKEAPAAIGPYSQAVATGPLIFLSGQLGIDPSTGKLAGVTIEEQTRQAMENIAAILDAAGSSLDLVVRMSVSLKDMKDFQRFNGVYGSFFEDDPPARITVEVSNLPLSALVMIEALGLRD
ncbi:MAG: RidA family protein [Candidatus Thermoplasmatota archaeon]|nr:RidA family protein [Candidatus Thermoplasmatota archaeon]